MWQLITKGGVMMWPLLITSIVTLAVVIERLIFIYQEHQRRDPAIVEQLMSAVDTEEIEAAIALAENSEDYVARTLVYGLKHSQESLPNALIRCANYELKRFNRGLPILDTVITLAPLLGLLGTVTGMIRAFGFLQNQELGAPTAITGGIAEALIATAFGLAVAILALIPFNYLNNQLEEARHEIEDAANHLEMLLKKRV